MFCPPETVGDFASELGKLGYLETTYYFQKTPDWRAVMQSMTQQSLAGMTALRGQ
jgi:hypothetical protein